MIDTIVLVLKIAATQGLFFGFYWLFLRKSSQHSLNRGYLLATLVLSFIIPNLQIDLPEKATEVAEVNSVILWLSETQAPLNNLALIPVKAESTFSWWILLPCIYGLVVVALIARYLVYLLFLQRLKKQSVALKKDRFTVFRTAENRAFSFFSSVFIPKSLFGTSAFDHVLSHECVHVRLFHSMDRLLLDFVVSLFWFNPFIYCYRNALIEIHEYQADAAVIQKFRDPISYQEILYSQLQSATYSGLVSHFNFQMIKKRIVMMNQKKKKTRWIYALTAPLTVMIIFAFSAKHSIHPMNEVEAGIAGFIGPLGTLSSSTEVFQQEENVPSVLPLKDTNKVRLTSSFGMRMHPIYKVEKMHLGADFSCPLGSEVIATADGVIEKIESKMEGYGKQVVIDHGSGFKTRYAQLESFKVEERESVKKGQVIALSGNSGMSTAPHLHYEVIREGKRVDPEVYILNYKFERPSEETHHENVSSTTQSEQEKKELDQLRFALAQKEIALARAAEQLAQKEKELALIRKEEMLGVQQEAKRALELAKASEEAAAQKTAEIKVTEERLKSFEALSQASTFEDVDFKIKIDKKGSVLLSDSKQPLYILNDQVVSLSELTNLNPNTIHKVVVLKGKNATSLYGKKAGNGVVVIESTGEKVKGKNKKKNKNRP